MAKMMKEFIDKEAKRKNIVLRKKSSKIDNSSEEGEKMPLTSAT
jgi:hypothetical protein